MRGNQRNVLLEKICMIDAVLGVIGVLIILCAAFAMQFFYHEMPCPLCLLQRAAFINMGIALLMHLKYGGRVSYWAMMMLSSLVGIIVSTRQVLLHINDPIGFGSAVFGMHMYTWCFIAFFIAILGGILILFAYPEKKSMQLF